MNTLLVRCSEDGSNDFSFIPYGLSQMTTNETYRCQIILQNNFLANMPGGGGGGGESMEYKKRNKRKRGRNNEQDPRD